MPGELPCQARNAIEHGCRETGLRNTVFHEAYESIPEGLADPLVGGGASPHGKLTPGGYDVYQDTRIVRAMSQL